MTPRLVAVAVPVPSLEPLTYRVPEGMTPERGMRVLVPVGRRTMTGCVLDIFDAGGAQVTHRSPGTLRDLQEIIDDEPLLPGSVLDLALWVADYYLCSAGEALSAVLPPFAWVQSRPSLRLTSAGRARLQEGGGGSLERLALETIGRREPVTRVVLVPALLRLAARAGIVAGGPSASAPPLVLPGLGDHLGRQRPRAETNRPRAAGPTARSVRARVNEVLDELVRRGLVAREHAMPGRRPGFRTVRVATLSASAADPSCDAGLSPKQRAALGILRDAGAGVEVAALAGRGVTPAVLAGLERRNLVSFRRRRVDRDPFDAGTGSCDAPRASVPADESGRSSAGHAEWQAASAGREAEKAAVTLTGEQQAALDRLLALAVKGGFRVALLHGVTGSGKTEVYRRLAAQAREAGRPVLILVPEIALTPALAATFRHSFGERVAIQHSALSDGERHDQWHRIRRGEVDVVVGTRSAVFAPLASPGLIIVDEEHDTSYKQEEAPRYHGRDVAIVRGRDAGALVVLGSATPALETYQNALAGRYERIPMARRVLDRPMADVRIVDMREEYAAAGPDVVLSRLLRERLADRLARGEQAIVLLNRRGYATAMFCRQCADALQCPNCSVSLTIHRAARRARCHYCDFGQRIPERCLECGAEYLEYVGVGTERVEREIAAALPGARVTRVDRDTVRRRGEIARVLTAFARREVDVLVGTQMLAKGHDFPAVTLVGVVSADVGLGLADFRAAERTFQLLTQVAGRAGRGDLPGEAVIQTLYPRHYSIVHARAQDYAAFFADEIAYRRAMRYPPAVSLVNLIVRGPTAREALGEAAGLVRALRTGAPASVRVLGPAPAPLERLRGEHRAQCFLKSVSRRAMRDVLKRVLAEHPRLARRVTIDVDPLSVL